MSDVPASKLKLDKLDVNRVNFSNKIVAMVGPRGSGKSYAIRHLLKVMSDIPYQAIFSKTENATHFFSKTVPDLYIFTLPDEKRLGRIIKRGETLKDNMLNAKDFAFKVYDRVATEHELHELRVLRDMDDDDPEIDKLLLTKLSIVWSTLDTEEQESLIPYIYVDPRSLIVYDDCLYDKSVFKTEIMRELFMNGRHYKIAYLFAMQSPKDIPPSLRDNIDYVFIYPGCEVKKVHESYLSDKIELKKFKKILKVVGRERFRCLVVQRTSGKPIEESMWVFKAEICAPFTVGCPLYQKGNKKYYNKNYKKQKNMSTLIREPRSALTVEV